MVSDSLFSYNEVLYSWDAYLVKIANPFTIIECAKAMEESELLVKLLLGNDYI
jgi:hypothetical protein